MNSTPPTVLVVAIDYSALSTKTLAHATGLAQLLRAELHVVHVSSIALPTSETDPSSTQPVEHNLYHQLRLDAETALQDFSANVPESLRVTRKVLFGQPEVLLPGYLLQLETPWLIVGNRHKTGVERALLGSVAEYLLRHATCPVLVIPDAE